MVQVNYQIWKGGEDETQPQVCKPSHRVLPAHSLSGVVCLRARSPVCPYTRFIAVAVPITPANSKSGADADSHP